MEWIDLPDLLQTFGVILAIAVSIGTLRSGASDRAAALTGIQKDIAYIKERIGGMEEMHVRLAGVELNAKSAHQRIDDHIKLEKKRRP